TRRGGRTCGIRARDLELQRQFHATGSLAGARATSAEGFEALLRVDRPICRRGSSISVISRFMMTNFSVLPSAFRMVLARIRESARSHPCGACDIRSRGLRRKPALLSRLPGPATDRQDGFDP